MTKVVIFTLMSDGDVYIMDSNHPDIKKSLRYPWTRVKQAVVDGWTVIVIP